MDTNSNIDTDDIGFELFTNPQADITSEAARILVGVETAVGIRIIGGTLLVVVEGLPSAAEYSAISRQAGMPITLQVASEDVFASLKTRADEIASSPPQSLEEIIGVAIRFRASDIHLSVGSRPKIRRAGTLEMVPETQVLSPADLETYTSWLIGDHNKGAVASIRDFDGAVSYGDQRFRVNVFRQRNQLAIAMRLIPSTIPSIADLGLPRVVEELGDKLQGLLLVVGATGSGKSTTLAAIVDRINERKACHIVTIEDPIEYLHVNNLAHIDQREVGPDTESFAIALRAALRQDPDVIMVGELRDLETISTAVSAAETGHLVLATLHANSAPEAISRIVDAFPASQQNQIRTQLAATIIGIVAQHLLPRSDKPDSRIVVAEVLTANTAIKALIREGKSSQIKATMENGMETSHMKTIDRALAELVVSGKIEQTLAHEYGTTPTEVDEQIAGLRAKKSSSSRFRSDND